MGAGVPAKWVELLVEQKIAIDDFTKVSEVKEANKLLRLKLSFGGETICLISLDARVKPGMRLQ